MKSFNGKVLFLDRSDINTDEIIPAKYLTEITKDALKPYLLEDLKLAGFTPGRDIKDKSAIVTRNNFGCGSSREHAPWALEVNNINLVIAVNFARIFRQNMYNCGMLALELPADTVDKLFKTFANTETEVTTDLAGKTLTFRSQNKQEQIPFTLGDFDYNLIKAGGWVEYAASHY
jgi:3-isopropylmalate/(R)-2-methylmalate dehydratase small subunit